MDQRTTIKLLDDTFRHDFDLQRFSQFIKELFNKFTFTQKSWSVWQEYQDYIESYQLLGSHHDGKKVIDVLVVKLKKTTSRDRARTMQRNFIAKYLGNAEKDAALVAFYGDDPQDWRFSFVKMEYQLVKDGEKVKVSKELTPAKRYSFLVGVNEPNHTCRGQFLNLVMEEEISPSLEEIEKAFSIEKVTKEFFEEYKELYHKLKESLENVLENDRKIKKEFEEKNISTVDFCKKLLGQIVFLYFLQKKGWLGVKINQDWGTGPKDFMKRLFDSEIIHYKNFFNDVLEPLFYDALNNPREGDDGYHTLFKCKIPFLNGGLFEPINDYNWIDTKINLDDAVFRDIFKTFDTYNFTVKEDEPLEKEVAVDPEMLGKVFENLLDVTDRKSKGAFYTPREIVHYMCQQSLINYLETNSEILREDLEKFIQLGDLALAQIIKEQEQVKKYGKAYDVNEKYSIPASIKQNHQLIDKLLKEIKVVDPAVGSGAFPVGMMNEIVRARSILSIYFKEARNDYDLKRETIENCLYGVDIESSAVDIAKLRFWLSLIVDELDMKNIKPLPNLDHKIMCGNSLLEEFEGKKLFDEKLLGEVKKDYSKELSEIGNKIRKLYESDDRENFEKDLEKLEKERRKIELEARKDKVSSQATLDDSLSKRIKESQRKLRELKELQKRFFNEQNRKLKKQLRDEIDKLEWGLVEETLKEEGNSSAMEKLQEYKKNKSKPFFLWKLYFAEVFQRENPGFDVVIGNPPYIGQKNNNEIFQLVKNSEWGHRFHQRRMDYFYFFFHKGLDLLKNGGVISFITTNYYLTATSADILRNDIKERSIIRTLINFNELRIFESATGQHNIISILQKSLIDRYFIDTAFVNEMDKYTLTQLNEILNKSNENTYYSKVENTRLFDTKKNYIRIPNSSNVLFLNKLLVESEPLGDICYISTCVQTGADKVTPEHIIKFNVNGRKGEGIFVLNKCEWSSLKLTQEENRILKPWYKNSDIIRWYTQKNTDERLIYITNKHQYKNIRNLVAYLNKFKTILINRNTRSGTGLISEKEYNDFVDGKIEISYVMIASSFKKGDYYCVSYARDEDVFEGPKIVAPQRSKYNTFGYNNISWYAGTDVHIIAKPKEGYNLKYILGLLNSKLYYYWLYHKGKRKGEILELVRQPISEIPIKEISPDQQKPFIHLVDQILFITKDDDYLDNPDKQAKVKHLEKEIDQLVYKLYELTPEEIKIVEGFGK